MKKYVILTGLALLIGACKIQAAEHTLKDILPGLQRVYTSAKKPGELPQIIQKYYANAQKQDFAIPFNDFVALYEALCKIESLNTKTQI